MTPHQQFCELRDSAGSVAIASLNAFYDSLPTVDCDFMLGRWQGGCFSTGHPGEGMLAQVEWCGKQFHSLEEVDPIMVRDGSGGMQASDLMGPARLRRVEYRGSVTATMLYDERPILDHFKRIDDDTALGVMDSKGQDLPLFFYLERCR